MVYFPEWIHQIWMVVNLFLSIFILPANCPWAFVTFWLIFDAFFGDLSRGWCSGRGEHAYRRGPYSQGHTNISSNASVTVAAFSTPKLVNQKMDMLKLFCAIAKHVSFALPSNYFHVVLLYHLSINIGQHSP